jgi:hypothetical protein
MFIYEFVTPSDAITFEAETDNVAPAVGALIRGGKAGTGRIDENGDEVKLPTMTMFSSGDSVKILSDFIGSDFEEFIKTEWEKIADACESFSYGSISSRKEYDTAIECITDPEKLEEFKKFHEDKNRTSMSTWVSYAWDIGKSIRSKNS